MMSFGSYGTFGLKSLFDDRVYKFFIRMLAEMEAAQSAFKFYTIDSLFHPRASSHSKVAFLSTNFTKKKTHSNVNN